VKDFAIATLALAVSIGFHAAFFNNAELISIESGKSDKSTSVKAKFRKIVKPKKIQEIPKPKPKKVVKKEIPAPVEEPEPVVEPEEEISEEVAQLDEEETEREKKHYLSVVMDCIERCKYYPAAARRRGITGEIEVHMTLLPNGEVESLVVEGKDNILCDAAREAVQKASPLPPPPSGAPYPVKLKMEFALQ